MINKFRAAFGRIEPVCVERETENSIWINGRRRAKRSEFDNYFDSWDSAHEFLMNKAKRDYDSALSRLKAASARIKMIQSLVKPD